MDFANSVTSGFGFGLGLFLAIYFVIIMIGRK